MLVKVMVGTDSPERCAQGFTVAATAASAGVPTSLWLTGEAVWFALPGGAESFELPHAAPLADLLATLLAVGQVTVCTQCAQRRGITQEQCLPGIRIAGAASFVEEALIPGTQALTY